MDQERSDGDLPEPTEGDYREGAIILIILIGVAIFELYLKSYLTDPVRNRAEVSVILLSIGLIHLLGSHLLAFLYNVKCPIYFCYTRKRLTKPWHAKVAGIIFLLAGTVNWFR